jgi:hypothetical protein
MPAICRPNVKALFAKAFFRPRNTDSEVTQLNKNKKKTDFLFLLPMPREESAEGDF